MINPFKSQSKLKIDKSAGFRQIQNHLFVALTFAPLKTVAQYKIILAVIHCTYGYGRTSEIITFQQLRTLTGGLDIRYLKKQVKELEDMRIIIIERQVKKQSGLPINRYMLNKYYDMWITPKTGVLLYTTETLKLVSYILKTGVLQIPKLVSNKTPPTYILKKERKKESTVSTDFYDPKGLALLKSIGIPEPKD